MNPVLFRTASWGLAMLIACESTLAGVAFEPPGPGDQPRNLLDAIRVRTLEQMRQTGLEEVSLRLKPWSGWFFPLNEGGLAARYADPDFPKEGSSWEVIRKYLLDNLGKGPIDELSPIEKYDLLLGDSNFSMTRKMIRIISSHVEADGHIEPWKGYCTGWAAASIMLPRPRQEVVALSVDGMTRVRFFPSDLKALAALLWSTGIFPTRYVGSLCQQSPIQRDPTNDRPLDSRCRDTSPATWHLALTNQVGLAERSILFDSDPGFQIWNQPVSSYRYRTFHPETGAFGPIESSRVELSSFRQDRFAGLRAPGTRWIIGVEMEVEFVYEKRPDLGSIDNPETDQFRRPIYRYDLELDSTGTIIGGEWWTRLHPDVIWSPLPRSTPTTVGDDLLRSDPGSWSLGSALPEKWADAARQSVTTFQPLGKIVNQLVQWAR
jgi:hypothetical protein